MKKSSPAKKPAPSAKKAQKNTHKFAVVASTYRESISNDLVDNCMWTLHDAGVSDKDIRVVRVPGALEIPLMAKKLAKEKKYSAIIVFGTVLKGDTYHFEQVSDECARGCMDVSYDFEVPVIFQVLSVYKLDDAVARSRGVEDNRGVEGAKTALAMAELYKHL